MTNGRGPRIPAQRTHAGGCVTLIDLRVVVCPGLSVTVPACLRYHSADPYAVHLDIHINLDAPVQWTFARELLATGLNEWAGTGEVSVYPGRDRGATVVLIALSGDESTVVLRAPAARVRSFVARTEHIVPSGHEHAHLDLEGMLSRLRVCGPAETENPDGSP